MSQISINTVPTIPMKISKKVTEISWLSDAAARETNSFDNKNTRTDKNLKK